MEDLSRTIEDYFWAMEGCSWAKEGLSWTIDDYFTAMEGYSWTMKDLIRTKLNKWGQAKNRIPGAYQRVFLPVTAFSHPPGFLRLPKKGD
jgi:hypothetical protein